MRAVRRRPRLAAGRRSPADRAAQQLRWGRTGPARRRVPRSSGPNDHVAPCLLRW